MRSLVGGAGYLKKEAQIETVRLRRCGFWSAGEFVDGGDFLLGAGVEVFLGGAQVGVA
jgi:hypothetical protein